jgi:hypothetical protein
MIVGQPAGAGTYRFRTVASSSLSGLFVKGEDLWFGKDGNLWHHASTRLVD